MPINVKYFGSTNLPPFEATVDNLKGLQKLAPFNKSNPFDDGVSKNNVTEHSRLLDLSWEGSMHIGAPDMVAGWDSGGNPAMFQYVSDRNALIAQINTLNSTLGSVQAGLSGIGESIAALSTLANNQNQQIQNLVAQVNYLLSNATGDGACYDKDFESIVDFDSGEQNVEYKWGEGYFWGWSGIGWKYQKHLLKRTYSNGKWGDWVTIGHHLWRARWLYEPPDYQSKFEIAEYLGWYYGNLGDFGNALKSDDLSNGDKAMILGALRQMIDSGEISEIGLNHPVFEGINLNNPALNIGQITNDVLTDSELFENFISTCI